MRVRAAARARVAHLAADAGEAPLGVGRELYLDERAVLILVQVELGGPVLGLLG